jgi:hypothetical protein
MKYIMEKSKNNHLESVTLDHWKQKIAKGKNITSSNRLLGLLGLGWILLLLLQSTSVVYDFDTINSLAQL